MKKVGAFKIENGSLYGPKQYMAEQGNAKLDKILSGKDTTFNMTAGYSPDTETAILVWMQTDYAGWKGARELMARCK